MQIEVKMKKVDGLRWGALEGDVAAPSFSTRTTGRIGAYPYLPYTTSMAMLHYYPNYTQNSLI